MTADAERVSADGPRHYRALLRPLPVDLRGADPFAGDLASPFALLSESRVEANIASMQRWCTEHGVELAPHGKTTMSPAPRRPAWPWTPGPRASSSPTR